MNISVYIFGSVKVMIDSKNERYVSYKDTTKRFGLYAMAKVDELHNSGKTVEEAYIEVFERLVDGVDA